MNNVNPFKKKRASLECFVREQIIGPGAFNKRYFFTEQWEQNEFFGQSIQEQRAIDNLTEVLAEVPAYQYSSGILFPISIDSNESNPALMSPSILGDFDEEELSERITKADDENFASDQIESVSSKNQNYPNTCGLSFAIESSADISGCLNVQISFRKYRKISQSECRRRHLGIWLQNYRAEIRQVFEVYFKDIFEVVVKGDNHFVCLNGDIDINRHLYSLDYVNVNAHLTHHLMPLIADIFPNKILFKETSKVYDSIEYKYVILYEESLVDEIRQALETDPSQYERYDALIRELEIHNQVKQLVNELKAIHRKSSRKNFPTPIWESVPVFTEVSLPTFPLTENVLRGEIKISGTDELFLNYQYLRHKNSNFIKLILVNKAKVEIGPNEPPQLNKKNEANELAHFGVQLRVLELIGGTIVPYNPPNLLVIDDEDSMNKLLYRGFKDYSEGYNTSVSWGQGENGLMYVSTEFLPEQETPAVDYRPTKIAQGKLISLIDESVLSMRELSTLSSKTNDEITVLLKSFIDGYGRWIQERHQELNEEALSAEGRSLLERQLMSCEVDYKRLARNIQLLKKNRQGMWAFRTMNTAMFMQLHHGLTIKSLQRTKDVSFVPTSNNAEYYRALKNDYRWRSFQLAFILLNVDAFIKPNDGDHTIQDVFGTGWPERNELADLVWFPTGGGKTEAYLGIIAFVIAYRRFTQESAISGGTTALMRYTLRLLTLQQFQRATMLICAMEVIRQNNFPLGGQSLGNERITIGLFVGKGSLPNKWSEMAEEISQISRQLANEHGKRIKTVLPHTECPWCGGELFRDSLLRNIEPQAQDSYRAGSRLTIMCNSEGCAFHGTRPDPRYGLPFLLFDEDIYKCPPTLLFGTVDKFAALANSVSNKKNESNLDSRRLVGKGVDRNCLPPELIIQDELHLLLGPLGSAVGLFEKSIDAICTQEGGGSYVRPKIITSTATTRNTDKQIFALFDRRSEVFPKQGIDCKDSFFSFYDRDKLNPKIVRADRKYVGLLPVGKTQVWMQLRVASICLAHRVKYLVEMYDKREIFLSTERYNAASTALDYYHTLLSYFNSLKEVGKTQSQLSHYLPGDLNLVLKNTVPWTILSRMVKPANEIDSSELTGRLSGQEVKTNLAKIGTSWQFNGSPTPPEFVIATNMISVGIDVARFNTMIINSMPRNTAEYIQASSRVARGQEGIVFTVHHPFRSRDISHYQRFKEFHEKFYGYVEPISVTPFASKALDRYFAMYLAVIIRHTPGLDLINNDDASHINQTKVDRIKEIVLRNAATLRQHADKLNDYLSTRLAGVSNNVEGIIGEEEEVDIHTKLDELLENRWLERIAGTDPPINLKFRDNESASSLFGPRNAPSMNRNWNVKESLREIAPSATVKTVQQ